jgi:hypothetical protein
MATNNSVDFVRKILNEFVKYRNVEANFLMVFTACADLNLQPSAVNAAPVTSGAKVRAVIERIVPKLGVNSDYSDAFAALWEARPELKLQCNENILAGIAGEEITGYHLIYLAGQPDVAEKLATTLAYQREQARVSAELHEAQKLAEEAAALQKELLDRYKDPTTGKLFKTILPQKFKQEEQRVLNLDIDSLRQEVAGVREKKRLASLSKDDLRKEIHRDAVQKQQSAYAERWPALPETWFPRGSYTGIPLNRDTLLQMAKNDVELFRRFVTNYGQQQIDARLNGQS